MYIKYLPLLSPSFPFWWAFATLDFLPATNLLAFFPLGWAFAGLDFLPATYLLSFSPPRWAFAALYFLPATTAPETKSLQNSSFHPCSVKRKTKHYEHDCTSDRLHRCLSHCHCKNSTVFKH
jgi:hypothetical protein